MGTIMQFLQIGVIVFYEDFHGDHGAGLGASYQTGWTGTIAELIRLFASFDAAAVLKEGKMAAFVTNRPD